MTGTTLLVYVVAGCFALVCLGVLALWLDRDFGTTDNRRNE